MKRRVFIQSVAAISFFLKSSNVNSDTKPLPKNISKNKILIKNNNNEPIGLIQSISITENRSDFNGQIIVEAKLIRALFNKEKIKNIFNVDINKVSMLANQQLLPINIEIINENDGKIMTTNIKNCWFKINSPMYSSEEYFIFDEIDIEAESIKSYTNTINNTI